MVRYDWRVQVTFAAAGPPIGALMWLIAAGAQSFSCSRTDFLIHDMAGGVLILLFWIVPASWVVGLYPALAMGILLKFLWTAVPVTGARRLNRVLSATVIGGTLSSLLNLFILLIGATVRDILPLLPFELIGTVSSALCALIVKDDWLLPPVQRTSEPSVLDD